MIIIDGFDVLVYEVIVVRVIVLLLRVYFLFLGVVIGIGLEMLFGVLLLMWMGCVVGFFLLGI